MSRILNGLKLALVAFLIPWTAMASFFALTQTAPPIFENAYLKRTLKLNPIWHDLPTAYLNQHRLVIAGLPVAMLLAAACLAINPKRKRVISFFTTVSIVTVATAANTLDCWWLFRSEPEFILPSALVRSIPWIAVGAIALGLASVAVKVIPTQINASKVPSPIDG
jgi:hypothetical protein